MACVRKIKAVRLTQYFYLIKNAAISKTNVFDCKRLASYLGHQLFTCGKILLLGNMAMFFFGFEHAQCLGKTERRNNSSRVRTKIRANRKTSFFFDEKFYDC